MTYSQGPLSSDFNLFTAFQDQFCFKILFCKHYFSPLNTFMRKGKDPDPGGPKTSGSGSLTLISSTLRYMKAKQVLVPCWEAPRRVTYWLTINETVSVNSFIYYSFWFCVLNEGNTGRHYGKFSEKDFKVTSIKPIHFYEQLCILHLWLAGMKKISS